MMAGATQLVRAFAGLRVGAVTVGAGPAMGWTKSMSTGKRCGESRRMVVVAASVCVCVCVCVCVQVCVG
jgi:hypothetical protein